MSIEIDITGMPDLGRASRSPSTTITASANGDPEAETIDSVTATMADEPDLNISGGATSVSISGMYQDWFTDTFYYVEKGESTNVIGDGDYTFDPEFPQHVNPTSVVGVENLPSGKELFGLDQDQAESKTRNLTVRVTYHLDSAPEVSIIENFTVSQKINNEWDAIKNAIANYY